MNSKNRFLKTREFSTLTDYKFKFKMSTKITVAGFISDPLFHKARIIAQKIEQSHKNVKVESLEFFET